MESWKAEVFIKAANELGEGPEWNPSSQILSWVDILAKKFHYFDFQKNQQHSIDANHAIGFAIPTTKKNIYISGQLDELYLIDIETKNNQLLKSVPENKKLNRFNDAKCDAQGRLWAGTTTDDFKVAPGALYKIENSLSVNKVITDVGCSNGQCWSADGKKMYYIDSLALKLRAYDFDMTSGAFSNETKLLDWPAENGYLDGMTIDAEGKLWIAIWNGGKVIRFCPQSKKIIGEVIVNAKNPTSAVFGGKNLEKLFITSARVGTEPADLKSKPEEGSVFVVETKIKGTQNNPFRLA